MVDSVGGAAEVSQGRWTVPGYTEVRSLGGGGFGEVVLATHDASGTPVAIKYLHPDLLRDLGHTAMFRAEARTLADLDSPHVVRLYEYVEGPAGAAIVMELVEGVTLAKILEREGKTTPEAALVVLFGSLLGLAAAHARGVVHRDYKPANVLVSSQGVSKLTDFGIAALAGNRPLPAGTLRYMPPEQFEGAAASPAADVYAATATFYQCLAGHVPFDGQTVAELYDKHRSAPVPMDPVPEPLRPVIARGMAKDPRYRPSDAALLAAELRHAATGSYGQDWADRGRSHLAEAALLLALLWPSGSAPAAVQGVTVQQVPLTEGSRQTGGIRDGRQARNSRHAGRGRPRTRLHLAVAGGTAVAVAAVATVTAVALTGHNGTGSGGSTAAAAHATTSAGVHSSSSRPAGSAPIPTPTPASSASLSPSALTGTWTGSYVCAQGETGLRLVIQAAQGGTLTATFNFFAVPGNPGVPSGSYTMTGTYSSAGVSLTPGQWINQPAGYEMVALSARPPSQGGTVLGGSITTCGTTFTLTRVSAG